MKNGLINGYAEAQKNITFFHIPLHPSERLNVYLVSGKLCTSSACLSICCSNLSHKAADILIKMSEENDWEVELHKTEHECDEHWELRRKFLVAHKDKFPEDELICLAQVFSNVELLGCR